MKPKTEEFLNFLLWSAQKLARPTFRNLTESYESWAYRNGFMAQAARLEKMKLIERDPNARGDRLYRLTEAGRLHALGGRDPETQWKRAWDGIWRLVLFDVPMRHNSHREKLRRYLRGRHFGCLQGSAWLSPDSLENERAILAGGEINVGSLVLLEARAAAGERDEDIVAEAWNFEEINARWRRHMEVLKRCPSAATLKDISAAEDLKMWAREEREAWLAAVEIDPLLPEPLLPPDYSGRRAWERRQQTLARLGKRLKSFTI